MSDNQIRNGTERLIIEKLINATHVGDNDVERTEAYNGCR